MITISPAGPEDALAIAALLEEMDRFYGASHTEPLDARLRQINEALFATPPAAYALLAWDGPDLAGFAAYSFLWPAAGLTRSLYLKELYVGDKYRRHGVGKLLMRGLIEVASNHRCSRVEWATDDNNAEAQSFYEALRYPSQPSKIFYRIEDTGTGFKTPG
jgi:GNAT superfamily N-acetyltransferase